jgi:hypothetical protein
VSAWASPAEPLLDPLLLLPELLPELLLEPELLPLPELLLEPELPLDELLEVPPSSPLLSTTVHADPQPTSAVRSTKPVDQATFLMCAPNLVEIKTQR